jgi:flagellar biosynthesis protein FlhA
MVTILEGISSAAPEVKDVNLITEAVRQRLARMISNQYRAIDGAMHVITLSPRVERLLADSIEYQNHNLRLNLEPRTAQKLMEITSKYMENMAAQGYLPIVLCSATIRLVYKRLVERALPSLAVLSYSEIASGIDVHAEGMIDLDGHNESKLRADPYQVASNTDVSAI